MNQTIDDSDTAVELARRRGDGLEITLLWHRRDNRLEVVVADARSGASFALATESGTRSARRLLPPLRVRGPEAGGDARVVTALVRQPGSRRRASCCRPR